MALAPEQERLHWVDTARGIGIILVVYAHALRGHMLSGAYDPAWQVHVQDELIYAFHMPLFFFLAGLFAQRSLEKGATAFIRNKAITLAYPYVLWSFVSIVLGMMAASAVNNAPSQSALFDLWHTPVYQYWFLYALLICQLVMLATRADWRITALLCGLSAIFGGVSGLGMITIAFEYYVYFGLGILLASRAAQALFLSSVLAGSALAFLAAFGATYVMIDGEPTLRLVIVVRALLGSAAIVALAMLLAPHARWLAVLGTASLSIFVLHTIFSSGFRMALHAGGYANSLAAVAMGTLIGLGAPMLIWRTARHYRVLPWLGLGAQPHVVQVRSL